MEISGPAARPAYGLSPVSALSRRSSPPLLHWFLCSAPLQHARNRFIILRCSFCRKVQRTGRGVCHRLATLRCAGLIKVCKSHFLPSFPFLPAPIHLQKMCPFCRPAFALLHRRLWGGRLGGLLCGEILPAFFRSGFSLVCSAGGPFAAHPAQFQFGGSKCIAARHAAYRVSARLPRALLRFCNCIVSSFPQLRFWYPAAYAGAAQVMACHLLFPQSRRGKRLSFFHTPPPLRLFSRASRLPYFIERKRKRIASFPIARTISNPCYYYTPFFGCTVRTFHAPLKSSALLNGFYNPSCAFMLYKNLFLRL